VLAVLGLGIAGWSGLVDVRRRRSRVALEMAPTR